MKKFEYDDTTVQMHNVLSHSFSEELHYTPEKDLKKHLDILCKYFPRSIKDNKSKDEKPRYENTNQIDVWYKAHQNVSSLLSRKIEHRKYITIVSISFLTLAVLTLTLGHRVQHTSKQHVFPEQLCSQEKSTAVSSNNLSPVSTPPINI